MTNPAVNSALRVLGDWLEKRGKNTTQGLEALRQERLHSEDEYLAALRNLTRDAIVFFNDNAHLSVTEAEEKGYIRQWPGFCS